MPAPVDYDRDGMLRIGGLRRFVLGAYAPPAGLDADDGLRALAEAGFGLVRTRPDGAELDAAHAAGLDAWCAVGSVEGGDGAGAERIRGVVRRLRGHPALLFWETVDEPAWTWGGAGARVPPEPLAATYRLIRGEDPDHLVYLNHAPTSLESTLRAYAPATDITACDIYPLVPRGIRPQYALFPDGMQGDLLNTYVSQVGEYTDRVRRVAGIGRPAFMVLQGFAWEALRDESDWDGALVVYPTYAETRFMAYQAIVHGAHGLLYWGLHRTPHDSPFWQDLRRVVAELAGLHDFLSGHQEPLPLGRAYHEMGHSVDRGVEAIVRRSGDQLCVIACNADKNPARVTFTGLAGRGETRVVGEGRAARLDGDGLTDDYAPFGVHVYVLGPSSRWLPWPAEG